MNFANLTDGYKLHGNPNGFESTSPSRPKESTGKWIVNAKGGPGRTFEICVIRSGNTFGQTSYGWFDDNKMLISETSSGSWSVPDVVWHKLLKVAQEVADELNQKEGL